MGPLFLECLVQGVCFALGVIVRCNDLGLSGLLAFTKLLAQFRDRLLEWARSSSSALFRASASRLA